MTDYQRIERVISYLGENHSMQPRMPELARVAGLSESHFHRLFSRWAGVTPKDFLKFLTLQHTKELLSQSQGLLAASWEAGLSGTGRLHDLFITIEGVSPGEFKRKGQGLTINYGFHPSPFGDCLVGVTDRGLCYLGFVQGDRADQLNDLKNRWPKANFIFTQAATKKIFETVFSKEGKISLSLFGTPFQLKVWEALLKIPENHLAAYGDIAAMIGSPKANRAVGTAVGNNPIAFLIPCHRVIRESGALGGYRWGIERKKSILAWESAKANRS